MAETERSSTQVPPIVVVTLNPTFDLILEAENFQVGRHQRVKVVDYLPAGKGLNVSRTLSTLSISSIITGFIGQENSTEFRQALDDDKIVGQLFTVPGRTRQNITIIDPVNSSDTHIRLPGPEVSREDLTKLGKKLSLLAEKGGLVVFAGSLPPGAEAEDLARLVRICRDAGAMVAVDTSGEPLKAATAQRLWLIKPNRAEFAELSGQADQTLEEMVTSAGRLTDRVENVLLSLGKEGALLVNRSTALRAWLEKEESAPAVNTVGSGDSLLGAFLAGIRAGLDLPDCLAQAVGVAWAACRTSIPASFSDEVARDMRTHVQLEQMKRPGGQDSAR